MKNHLKVSYRSDPTLRKKLEYKVRARVWLWSGGAAAWHFVTIPVKQSREIERVHGGISRGWGSIPVVVTLGKSSWKTSIFPYKKVKAFILPLKADIRKKEGIGRRDLISFNLSI